VLHFLLLFQLFGLLIVLLFHLLKLLLLSLFRLSLTFLGGLLLLESLLFLILLLLELLVLLVLFLLKLLVLFLMLLLELRVDVGGRARSRRTILIGPCVRGLVCIIRLVVRRWAIGLVHLGVVHHRLRIGRRRPVGIWIRIDIRIWSNNFIARLEIGYGFRDWRRNLYLWLSLSRVRAWLLHCQLASLGNANGLTLICLNGRLALFKCRWRRRRSVLGDDCARLQRGRRLHPGSSAGSEDRLFRGYNSGSHSCDWSGGHFALINLHKVFRNGLS